MVYTLNGPGPLRGLPSLAVVSNELESREILPIVDKAIERYGLVMGKRFLTVECLGSGGVNPMVLRALKTRGFSITAVVDVNGSANPQLFDMLVVNTESEEIDIMANSIVYNPLLDERDTIRDPVIVDQAQSARKYLQAPKVTPGVLNFLRSSKYAWTLLIGRDFPEVNCV